MCILLNIITVDSSLGLTGKTFYLISVHIIHVTIVTVVLSLTVNHTYTLIRVQNRFLNIEICDHCRLNIKQQAYTCTILRRGELSVPFYYSQYDFFSFLDSLLIIHRFVLIVGRLCAQLFQNN